MTIPSRKPRADAERNRQLLLEIAKTKFAVKGTATTLDEIAKTAGVGIGTLYRHFPTREALLEEVYRNESDQLAAAARSLQEALPAWDALRQWLLLFADYLANRQLMAEAVSPELCAVSRQPLTDAVLTLVAKAEKESGSAVAMSGIDMLAAIAGVVNVSKGPDFGAGARALVDALISGLQRRRG
jgi:AcrR family transcriptional regulator